MKDDGTRRTTFRSWEILRLHSLDTTILVILTSVRYGVSLWVTVMIVRRLLRKLWGSLRRLIFTVGIRGSLLTMRRRRALC